MTALHTTRNVGIAVVAALLVIAGVLWFFAESAPPAIESDNTSSLAAEIPAPQSPDLLAAPHEILRQAEDEPAMPNVDPGLRVLVLGPDGLALPGASVAVVEHLNLEGQDAHPRPVWSRETDQAGRVQNSEIAELIRATPQHHRRAVMVEGFVPQCERVYLSEPKDWSAEIMFRTPAHGEVHVRATDPTGRAVLLGRALVVMPGEDYDEEYIWNKDGAPSLSLKFKDGVAVFRHVGLDRKLIVCATMDKGSSIEAMQRVQELTYAGEVIDVDLQLGTGQRLIQACIKDRSGLPLSGISLVVEMKLESGGFGARHCQPLENGLIWFDTRDAIEKPSRGQVTLSSDTHGIAAFNFECKPGAGLTDVGDVLLDPPTQVLAGIAENPDGSRPAHAELYLCLKRPADAPRFRLQPNKIYTDRDGNFAYQILRAPEFTTEDRVGVLAITNEFTSALQYFPVGTTTAQIRLEAPGRIDAPVRGPRWLIEGNATYTLRSSITKQMPSLIHLSSAIRDGRLKLERIPAGTYSLHGPENAIVLADLVIESGVTCTDPRLQPLELHDERVELEFELIAFDGLEPILGELHVRRSDLTPKIDEHQKFYLSPARVVVPHGSYDGGIYVEGARFETFTGVKDKHQITLRPGYEIELRLPAETPLPERPETLRAELTLQGGFQSYHMEIKAPPFDRNGRVRLRAPGVGQWSLNWKRGKLEGASVREREIEGAMPQHITVLDQAELQVFDLQAPPL